MPLARVRVGFDRRTGEQEVLFVVKYTVTTVLMSINHRPTRTLSLLFSCSPVKKSHANADAVTPRSPVKI